jgi:hypothetical protein
MIAGMIEMMNDYILKIISQRSFTLFAALLFSVLCLNWSVPVNFDADTILQSLMSTQKVTLFYWGQDRYANFLPFIYSWLKSPTLNLLLILFTSGLAYFLLLELVSDACARYHTRNVALFRTILFFCLVFVSVVVLNKKGLYVFAYSAQPYSLSFLLLGYTWVLAVKPAPNLSASLLVALLLFVAIGVNPSIILICAVSFIFFYTSKRNSHYFLVPLLSLLFFGFWQYVSKTSVAGHEEYSQLSAELLFKGLRGSTKHFIESTETLGLTVSLLAATVALSFLTTKNAPRFRANFLIAVIGVSAVAWWLLFAMSTYVSRNEFHFRYFFPTLLALLVLISFTLADFLLALKERIMVLAVGAVYAFILAIIITPYKPISYWHSSGVFDSVGQYLRATESRILTGGYWQVWPALFRIQSTNNRKDAEGRPWVYAAASRGKVNRAEMDSLIVQESRQGRMTTAVCIGAETEQCLNELTINTSFDWQFVEEGNCFTMKCYLFRVKN